MSDSADAPAGPRLVAEERRRRIEELVRRQAVASLGEVLEVTGASEATARRDLVLLERLGLLARTRGGARAVQRHSTLEEEFEIRQSRDRREKRLIAQRAAELIDDGMTLFLDGRHQRLRAGAVPGAPSPHRHHRGAQHRPAAGRQRRHRGDRRGRSAARDLVRHDRPAVGRHHPFAARRRGLHRRRRRHHRGRGQRLLARRRGVGPGDERVLFADDRAGLRLRRSGSPPACASSTGRR